MNKNTNDFTLERVPGTPAEVGAADLESLAAIYANAFAGPPWNEYTRCPTEGSFYGTNTEPGQPCACGQADLAPAYPLAETVPYIAGELQRPDAALFLLRNATTDELAGFSWGFSYPNADEFAREKYNTPNMQADIRQLLRSMGLAGKFYYLSESGIKDSPEYRGKGISKEFHRLRLEVASSLGLRALQRTSCEGPMYQTSRNSGMAQIMGPEVVVDTTARRFQRTGRIINNCIDTENEPRTLFMM